MEKYHGPHGQRGETLALSKKLEGLRLKAYPDPGSRDGKPVTIGYGTTRISGKAVTLATTITEAQAEKYHLADLEAVTAAVERMVKVPLNENQFGAITLFANNVGAQRSPRLHVAQEVERRQL